MLEWLLYWKGTARSHHVAVPFVCVRQTLFTCISYVHVSEPHSSCSFSFVNRPSQAWLQAGSYHEEGTRRCWTQGELVVTVASLEKEQWISFAGSPRDTFRSRRMFTAHAPRAHLPERMIQSIVWLGRCCTWNRSSAFTDVPLKRQHPAFRGAERRVLISAEEILTPSRAREDD